VSTDQDVGRQIGDTILAGFVDYIAGFRKISRRAQRHFTQREWTEQDADSRQRLTLHRSTVVQTVERVQPVLDGVADRRGTWRTARAHYKRRIADRSDLTLAETFFNSVTRRTFTTIGVDNDVELRWFGATTVPRGEGRAELFTTASRLRDTSAMVRQILESYDFEAPWADLEADARRVAARMDSFLIEEWDSLEADGIDMLRPVFYRNKAAYLVGRLRQLNRVTPIVFPILHGADGLRIDTVLLTESQASRLFSFTRSYFFVEWPNPSELVGFLKSLLPMKSLAELYTAIGFPQHGKTSLYRSLYRHLDHSHDKFVRARGTPGMVMAVFTLVSFNVVFKIIKDRFDPPKNTTRDAVKRRYALVYNHDRVGRMVEAWEFENLSFDRDRFDPGGSAGDDLRVGEGEGRPGGDQPRVHGAAGVPPEPVPAGDVDGQGGGRGHRLGLGHQGPGGGERLPRRPLHEELRRDPTRQRRLLRLRRADPAGGVPVPGHSRVRRPGRRDAATALVLHRAR
jgi:isocitrate dehydrogenase kinase/phosphatase